MKHIGILAHSADGAALISTALDAYERGDLAAVNAQLVRTCERFVDAGCDFFVCPDNTAHLAIDAARSAFPLPELHIADIVAERARAEGRRRVARLGTRWTLEGRTYPAAFARAAVDLAVPTPEERRIIERMKGEGCDAVALSCTEIPLLVMPDVSPMPTLDSTRLLARAAVTAALA